MNSLDYDKIELNGELSALTEVYLTLVKADRPMTKKEIKELIFDKIKEVNDKLKEKGL